jgi:nicotinamidase-related amidase
MGNKKSIFLVLDMQNDLVHEDGPNGKGPLGEQVRARNVLEKTASLIEAARRADVLIGFVRVGFSEGYVECPPNSPVFAAAAKNGLFKLGTWGTEIHPSLAQRVGDVQVVKHRVSPFYSTTLEAQLRAQKIERIYCCGVSTQAVVQATTRDAHDRDYDVVVFEDACAAHSAEEHANSINSLRRFARIAKIEDARFEE